MNTKFKIESKPDQLRGTNHAIETHFDCQNKNPRVPKRNTTRSSYMQPDTPGKEVITASRNGLTNHHQFGNEFNPNQIQSFETMNSANNYNKEN